MAPLLAPGAGASVGNPGNLQVSMSLSFLTPTFSVEGMSTVGSGTASVSKTGVIKIPQPSLSFQPVDVQVDLPAATQPGDTTSTTQAPTSSTVSVRAVVLDDFRGALNPKSGAAFLVGNVELMLTQADTMTDCPVGPFQIVARTNAPGGNFYSEKTGSVTMVDPVPTVDAIPDGTDGCAGLESAVNDAISLPVTTTTTTSTSGPTTTTTTFTPGGDPPVPSVVVSLTFVPALTGAVPQPLHQPRGEHTTTTTTARPTETTPTTTAAAPPSRPARQPTFNQPRPTVRKTRANPNKVRHPGNKNPNKKTHPNKKNPNKKSHPKVKKAVSHAVRPKTRAHTSRTRGTYLPGATTAAAATPKKAAPKSAPRAAGAEQASRQLTFVTAAFHKPSPSALSTGLNVLGLLGLLVFSSLALWLVTSEVTALSASARRQRAHRIAGVTQRR